MEDKRIFERIGAEFSVKLLNPENGSEADGVTFDISANGVGLTTNGAFYKGHSLEMWLRIPDQHAPLYCRGEVAWLQPRSSTNQQRIGVCLHRAELMGLARVLWMKRRTTI